MIERPVLLCPRRDGRLLQVRGSMPDKCDTCGYAVDVSPSGQRMREKGARIQCLHCTRDNPPDPSKVAGITKEQIKEVLDSLRHPPKPWGQS